MARFERSLTGIALFLSVQSLLFLCIALASATAEVRFAHASKSVAGCDLNVAFGLQRYYSFSSCKKDTFDGVYYKSDTCKNGIGSDECSECESSGIAVLFFLVLAFLVLLFTVVIQFLRLAQVYTAPEGMWVLEGIWPSVVNKFTSSVLLFVSSALCMIVFAIMAGACYKKLQDSSALDGWDFELSSGFAVMVVAFVFTLISGVVEMLKLPDPEAKKKGSYKTPNANNAKSTAQRTDVPTEKGPPVPVHDLTDFLDEKKDNDGLEVGEGTDGAAADYSGPPPLPTTTDDA